MQTDDPIDRLTDVLSRLTEAAVSAGMSPESAESAFDDLAGWLVELPEDAGASTLKAIRTLVA